MEDIGLAGEIGGSGSGSRPDIGGGTWQRCYWRPEGAIEFN